MIAHSWVEKVSHTLSNAGRALQKEAFYIKNVERDRHALTELALTLGVTPAACDEALLNGQSRGD
ncbi:hypothetical protein CWR53_08495 [Pseudomonas sp. SGAir0191]|uniref:hypothetical protein n=1 Tax=Pseudomonas TaxID=286 RepID=UPI000733FDCC|nr:MULTISPECIES: hypothetical protein [Pseudomonas]AUA32617.1 hypothetical protein CWR53_08495 [Pseudomonas sp. SGAir0191]KTS99656.1 hypothetical protein NS212_07085 [Pseudomonas parafulva]